MTDAIRKKDWRSHFVLGVFAIFGLAILARLFFLQVSSADYYREKARDQYLPPQAALQRGDIFFKDKDGRLILAATTNRTYLLHANPVLVSDPQGVIQRLKAVTPLDENDALEKLSDKSTNFKIISKGIEKDTASKIISMNMPGIEVTEEEVRVYPGGKLASHVLGFVGFLEDKKAGRYGIEKEYEGVLKGEEVGGDASLLERAVRSFGRTLFATDRERKDIALTIDPNLQSFVEKRMAEANEEWGADGAGALVVDPKTGKVLAMAAVPSFDPNFYNKEKDYTIFINPFVQEIYEMGSVFKPLTMAAAIDAGVVGPNTTYHDTGKLVIGNAVIENFDGKARGMQTMTNVLEQSLNTGSVFAMRKLGHERFRDYFEVYGLAELTGIDLPSEAKGNLKNIHTDREIEFAAASFGQGVAVTPVELAAALSSLANGGQLMRPYVVESIMKDGVVIEETKPEVRKRTISPETSQTISRMLTSVVDNTLAGGAVKMEGYSLAAKTGTAQISNANDKGYSEDYLHTYFGYGPSFDPRFLVLLYLERPRGVKYSSQSLTPAFTDIVKFLISYYEIPPDRLASAEPKHP